MALSIVELNKHIFSKFSVRNVNFIDGIFAVCSHILIGIKPMMMKLSRVKILLQGGVRLTLQCIGPKNGGGMEVAIIQRGKSTAISTGQEYCIMDSCSIKPNCKEPRVIIVGAGIAGLSAAHRLTQCGIRNFVVLEAKERFVKFQRFHGEYSV